MKRSIRKQTLKPRAGGWLELEFMEVELQTETEKIFKEWLDGIRKVNRNGNAKAEMISERELSKKFEELTSALRPTIQNWYRFKVRWERNRQNYLQEERCSGRVI